MGLLDDLNRGLSIDLLEYSFIYCDLAQTPIKVNIFLIAMLQIVHKLLRPS